jgi:hypothetical protein
LDYYDYFKRLQAQVVRQNFRAYIEANPLPPKPEMLPYRMYLDLEDAAKFGPGHKLVAKPKFGYS